MKYHSENIVRSSEVIGKNVVNQNNEEIGKIEEIVLDKVSGKTRYVVLSFGGFLGMGDKYFAFPWKSISYSKEIGAFMLNVSKEKLKNENGFSKDNWPDMTLTTWSSTIDDYYE